MNFHKVFHINVDNALSDIKKHPELWGMHGLRKSTYAHSGMTDIWVRYNDIKNLGPNFNDEHESVWYLESDFLPNVKTLAFQLMYELEGTRLGGILITKLPPGGKINPHVDSGWHAGYYEKFYVALQNDEGSIFCWENETLKAQQGDVYWFRNDKVHWVENNSDMERISMIVCMRQT